MFDVVIVEDEDIIRQGLIYTIDWASMGCRIAGSARDGAEGIQVIRAVRPDIVITDIKMPKKNGIAMIAECQEACVFKTIILTSYSEFEYAQKAVSLHIFEYLLKPVEEAVLRRVIAAIQSELAKDEAFIRKKHHRLADISGSPFAPYLLKIAALFDITLALEQCRDCYVRKALKKIIVAYNEPLSITTIAAECGVSVSYVSRRFKSYTGKTFVSVLNIHRIYKAVELIKENRYLMNEVAVLCGFSEYKYFHAVFKKYTGISPGELQNMCNLPIFPFKNT